jgi:glucose-1-phosphate adenylyltransferase
MDYEPLAEFHWQNQADITIAVQPVLRQEAYRFGLLKRGQDGRITDFTEKPKDPQVQERFTSRDDPERPFLGSMGIYMFQTQVLVDLLTSTTDDDFGGEVIPSAIGSRRVFGFDFDGFWEDIGTIRSFYDTNLRLAQPDSPFDLYDPARPIYTHARFLPGSVLEGASLSNVLLSDGSRIQRAEVRNSIVGLRSQIAAGTRLVDSIMMGADYYETHTPSPQARTNWLPLGLGENCDIQGSILDKNVRIGPGVVIRPFPRGTEIDNPDWVVRDGIVVIPKNTWLPEGTLIGPEA